MNIEMKIENSCLKNYDVSQHYCFSCISGQINAVQQQQKKITQNFWMATYYSIFILTKNVSYAAWM